MIFSYNGTPHSNPSECIIITNNSIDEPHKYNVERNKWSTKMPLVWFNFYRVKDRQTQSVMLKV